MPKNLNPNERARLIAEIRADGAEIDVSRSDQYLAAFHRAYFSRRDALGDVDGDPDGNDNAHRAARGANSAVKNPNTKPDVAGMNLQQVKAVALSIGSYSSAFRAQLAREVLARLADLGATQVANSFADSWSYGGLDAMSDQEAEEAGDAMRGDDIDAENALVMKQRAAQQAREQLASPSNATTRRAGMPAAKRRSR